MTQEKKAQKKPNTKIVMISLIDRINADILDKASKKNFCTDSCRGCAIKLINYLTSEVEFQQQKLDNNEQPSFADINKLSKTAAKIHKAIYK